MPERGLSGSLSPHVALRQCGRSDEKWKRKLVETGNTRSSCLPGAALQSQGRGSYPGINQQFGVY
jgi:hypothetical protein